MPLAINTSTIKLFGALLLGICFGSLVTYYVRSDYHISLIEKGWMDTQEDVREKKQEEMRARDLLRTKEMEEELFHLRKNQTKDSNNTSNSHGENLPPPEKEENGGKDSQTPKETPRIETPPQQKDPPPKMPLKKCPTLDDIGDNKEIKQEGFVISCGEKYTPEDYRKFVPEKFPPTERAKKNPPKFWTQTTNMLGFDNIYVIGRRVRLDRKFQMAAYFEAAGLGFELHVGEELEDLTVEHRAKILKRAKGFHECSHLLMIWGLITEMHMWTWQNMLDRGYNYVMVFEDDQMFAPDFLMHAKERVKPLQDGSLDWDIVYFQHQQNSGDNEPELDPPVPGLRMAPPTWGTNSYAVSRSGAQKLLKFFEAELSHAVDSQMAHFQHADPSKPKVYLTVPTAVAPIFSYGSDPMRYAWKGDNKIICTTTDFLNPDWAE